jgi:hypothetical protein
MHNQQTRIIQAGAQLRFQFKTVMVVQIIGAAHTRGIPPKDFKGMVYTQLKMQSAVDLPEGTFSYQRFNAIFVVENSLSVLKSHSIHP